MTFAIVCGIIQKTTYKGTKYRKGVIMKNFKRFFTVAALSLSMLTTSVAAQNIVGAQETVQAATVKLNKKSIKLTMEKSTRLKVIGTKKKLYWYSLDPSIAKVNQKGVVKAINAGKTEIWVNVGNKTLECKVTVKDCFSERDAKKNTDINVRKNSDVLYVMLKNNYKEPETIRAKCYFYDAKGILVDAREANCFFLEVGREALMTFYCPDNYSTYKISYEFSNSMYHRNKNASVTDKIKIKSSKVEESEYDNEKILVTFTNNSKYTVSANAIIKYYDGNGNMVAACQDGVEGLKSHSTDVVAIETPVVCFEDSYYTIPYSRYEVVLSTAEDDNWQ